MLRKISLDGSWQFKEEGGPWRSAQVPGCVQLDLMRHGLLPDPFYRMNEEYAYGLEEKAWVYQRNFELDEIPPGQIDLVCEGLDTVASLYLNDHFLGQVENMFIPHRFDVTEHLRAGKNTIRVQFASAVEIGKKRKRSCSLDLKGDERIFLRKAQYSFGWDWGPRLVQTGIWRSIYLESYKARLVMPYLYMTSRNAQEATVKLEAGISGPLQEDMVVEVVIREEGDTVARVCLPVVKMRREGEIKIPNPRLWYPNGYGEQPLYTVDLTLKSEGEALDGVSFKTGLRSVQLLRQRDEEGQSFIFLINGLKVFAKGANWIPADSFLPRLTDSDYEDYIRLAKEANMNMLRVWGGGIYEEPAFYEACDRAGIMVWQDFMYACAQYPDHLESFQGEARKEAEVVVQRLRNHPSIVLWCGNNENNWGFHSWWHVGDPKYRGNYIYKEILPQVINGLDPSRPYWISSPYGGEEPNCQGEGDRHNWDVWSSWQDYGAYLNDRGRFLSEFGFQAMPSKKTVLSYTEPGDRKIFSTVTGSHNKMHEGTERLLRFLAGRLGLPKDYQSFIYMTQLNQALAIKLGVEHWRSRKFQTSGTLYWQFNDCWPVASWSALDYYRRKKALYYHTRKFFDDLLIVLKAEEDGLQVKVVSDRLKVSQGKLRLSAYSLEGELRGEVEMEISIPLNAAHTAAVISYEQLGIGGNEKGPILSNSSNTILIKGEDQALLESIFFAQLVSGETYGNYLTFQRLRDLPLPDPGIRHIVEGNRIILMAEKPAFGVFIETENDVDLDDNCLTLEPRRGYIVTAKGKPGEVSVLDLTKMRLNI